RWQAQKMTEDCFGFFAGGDNANMSDRLFAATERSHDVSLQKFRRGAKVLQDSLRLFQRAMQQYSFFSRFELFDIFEKLRFGLLTEAFDIFNYSFFASGLEVRYAFNPECIMERNNFPETQPRDFTQLDRAGRQLVSQLSQHPTFARVVNLFDDRSQRCANARDFRQA